MLPNGAIIAYCSHLPAYTCKRRVKGATLDVAQPHLIAQYNKGMGEVDLWIVFYPHTDQQFVERSGIGLCLQTC